MKSNIRKFTIVTIGISLLLLGVIGIILPILNGTIFLVLGLALLSLEFPSLDARIESIVIRNKYVEKIYRKIRNWLQVKFKL